MNPHYHNNPFLIEKMVKKRYYRNECLGLAWDRIEVCQMNLFITTVVSNARLEVVRARSLVVSNLRL